MNKHRSLLTILLIAGFLLALGGPVEAQSLQENSEPISDAGPDQVVIPSTLVILDGSASSDPDGNLPLTYQWTQTSGTSVTLSDATAVNPTFTAPMTAEVLTFELTVTDSLSLMDSTPDAVQIIVSNPPAADAGPDQTVGLSALVTLDGSASSDPDGNLPLTYLWTQTGGTTVTLSDAAAVKPTFTAPAAAEALTFELTVTDALGLADATPDQVIIHVTNPPVADAGADRTVGMNTLVTLDGSASSDPDGNLPLTYLWTQTAGTAVTLTGVDSAAPSFTAPNALGALTFSLMVTDSLGMPALAADEVTIVVDYNYVYLPIIMTPFPPAAFNKASPSSGAVNQLLTPQLSWGSTAPVSRYEYCIDSTNDNACTSWISTGTSTSVTLPPLTPNTTYYWQVRAWNSTAGPTYANGSATAFWSFKTIPMPGAFSKTSPSNGLGNHPVTTTLYWGPTSPVTKYEYCYDSTNDNACSSWIPNGTSTSVTLPTLSYSTTYYWQVRAWNGAAGPTYANGSATAFWSFTTIMPNNPILNGGFELGDVYWAEYSTHGWDIILNPEEGLLVSAHNGTWATWLGGDYSDISYISQTITIPAGRSYLHYWIITGSSDFCGYDFFEVRLGSKVVYSQSVCYENNTIDWMHRVLDLTPYAGTTQTLMFRVTTDSGYNSNVFLDDISFEVSSITASSMDQFTVANGIDSMAIEKLIQSRKEDFSINPEN